jgi:hypothetical protein
MKRKEVFWAGFLFLIVFIAGCTGGTPDDINDVAAITSYVRSGTTGLEMEFVNNLPPPQIYDTSDLVVLLELKNTGAHDISGNDCFVEIGGFDDSIIRGVNKRQTCGELEGKNVYNQEGGFDTVEFKSTNIGLPKDVDRHSPPIVVTACYEYQTIAATQVCVDPLFFELTAEQKACQVRDVGLGGGQGGPVSATYVNVDMVGSKAIFDIEVANVGPGRVISPRANIATCPTGLRYDDFDQVRYRVELPGAKMIRCTPSDFLVRLGNGGRGRIVCTFDVGNTQAYETPLKIELNYNYMNSIRDGVEIIRTPS